MYKYTSALRIFFLKETISHSKMLAAFFIASLLFAFDAQGASNEEPSLVFFVKNWTGVPIVKWDKNSEQAQASPPQTNSTIKEERMSVNATVQPDSSKEEPVGAKNGTRVAPDPIEPSCAPLDELPKSVDSGVKFSEPPIATALEEADKGIEPNQDEQEKSASKDSLQEENRDKGKTLKKKQFLSTPLENWDFAS